MEATHVGPAGAGPRRGEDWNPRVIGALLRRFDIDLSESASLLLCEIVVFGRAAAHRAAEVVRPDQPHKPLPGSVTDAAVERLERMRNAKGRLKTGEIRLAMQRTMQNDCAVFRTAATLDEGLRSGEVIVTESGNISPLVRPRHPGQNERQIREGGAHRQAITRHLEDRPRADGRGVAFQETAHAAEAPEVPRHIRQAAGYLHSNAYSRNLWGLPVRAALSSGRDGL